MSHAALHHTSPLSPIYVLNTISLTVCRVALEKLAVILHCSVGNDSDITMWTRMELKDNTQLGFLDQFMQIIDIL